MQYINGKDLKKGHTLLLPFGKEAEVLDDPKVGTRFVTFRTPHGKTRVGLYDILNIPDEEPDLCKATRLLPPAHDPTQLGCDLPPHTDGDHYAIAPFGPGSSDLWWNRTSTRVAD